MSADDRIMRAIEQRGPMSGAKIAEATGLWSGFLYPALAELETSGALNSKWAEDDEYPRRRIYSLPPPKAQERDTEGTVRRYE